MAQILSLSTILITSSLTGQKWTLSLDLYPNISSKLDRPLVLPYGGLGMMYHYDIKSINFVSGLSFRSIVWGNEISFDQSIILPISESGRVKIQNMNSLHLSYPLFYNKQSLAFGVSSKVMFTSDRLSRIRFYIGVRYSNSPTYGELSKFSGFFEGNFGCNIVLKK